MDGEFKSDRLPFRHVPTGYDAVIGLGAACQVAEQCRRHLGAAPGVPFDWIITPFDAIGKVLADKGAGLGQRFVSIRGGTSTQCVNYGVLYEHEFPRDPDRQVIFDAETIADCRSRMAYKMQKLIKILGSHKKILFIRAYASTGLPGDRFNDEPLTSADLNHLAALIEGWARGFTFDLLFVHSPDRTGEKVDLSGPLSSRVQVREMPHPPGTEWWGIDEHWIALFDEFGLLKPKLSVQAGRPSL